MRNVRSIAILNSFVYYLLLTGIAIRQKRPNFNIPDSFDSITKHFYLYWNSSASLASRVGPAQLESPEYLWKYGPAFRYAVCCLTACLVFMRGVRFNARSDNPNINECFELSIRVNESGSGCFAIERNAQEGGLKIPDQKVCEVGTP
jgi:hypothetical protein